MDLCKDICVFLSENGLSYTVENHDGHEIIYSGESPAIVPICIFASSQEKAKKNAESLQTLIEGIHENEGKYPLIITEDRWLSQARMMRSRLLAHLHVFTQIYARNCEIRKIDKATAARFLSENHSYGDASCRYRYGLFLKRYTGHTKDIDDIRPEAGSLVAVATFSNARKWTKGDKIIRSYEWTRYATLPELRLSGGMGRLLKTFIEEVKPDDIMTYADLEWSEGTVYQTLGFELEGRKDAVMFSMNLDSWQRTAIKEQTSCADAYFQNFGSNKYRLKLTDYQ